MRILTGLAICFLPVLLYSEQKGPDRPPAIPEPSWTFPKERDYSALKIGPGNTFSVGKVSDDRRLSEFAISPDGRVLALAWRSGRVEMRDLHNNGSKVSEFNTGLGVPMSVQFNASGKELIVAGLGGRVAFFDFPSGKKLRYWKIKLGKRKYDLQEIVLDPDGQWIAYANADNSKVLDLHTDRPSELADLGIAGSIALSQDHSELWTVSRKQLERFSTSTWQRTGQWPLKSKQDDRSPVLVRTGISSEGEPSVAVPSVDGLVIYREPGMAGEYATDRGSRVTFERASHTYLNLSRELSFLSSTGELLCSWTIRPAFDYGVSEDGQWIGLSQAGHVDLWRIADLLRPCTQGHEKLQPSE